VKRLFDILVTLLILSLVFPLFLFAALGIKLSSPGPVFYRAQRIGKGRKAFEMLKFRSMHISTGGPVITSQGDRRIFTFGNLIRKLKIDEIPQFINVLKGDMSIVGPRPEDPKIVTEAYTDWMMETLDVRPGITSPGAIFYYTMAEGLIDDDDPEGSYISTILPLKLAVERAYINRATILSDLFVVFHTTVAVIGNALNMPIRPSKQDLEASKHWVSTKDFNKLG
jgi:lipopolysaccharide/colanic/teichoic acid biosynthesis glycosyltransferase